jgi:hypothetical protein
MASSPRSKVTKFALAAGPAAPVAALVLQAAEMQRQLKRGERPTSASQKYFQKLAT